MPQETRLEMAERYVLQSESNVARQKQIVDLKRERKLPMNLSEQILQTLEDTLALHREQLARLQAGET